jgi:hypothetical protein
MIVRFPDQRTTSRSQPIEKNRRGAHRPQSLFLQKAAMLERVYPSCVQLFEQLIDDALAHADAYDGDTK